MKPKKTYTKKEGKQLKLSQNDRVLIHLWEKGELSSLDATRLNPPIMRLASRVHEIRKAGFDIPTRNEKTTTGGRYAVYTLSANDLLRIEGV